MKILQKNEWIEVFVGLLKLNNKIGLLFLNISPIVFCSIVFRGFTLRVIGLSFIFRLKFMLKRECLDSL